MTRGSDVGGLLRYLYGPGKVNEHTDPHLVASWRGDDGPTLAALEPAPGRARRKFQPLADLLSLPLSLLPEVPPKHVWQCSMRLAEKDRHLTDAEWAVVAGELMEATGFAQATDANGCRWVAVRHAEDHIHVVVVLARQDGRPVDSHRDWPKVHAAARAIEKRFGLTTVPSPDQTATVAPTRAETEKAVRTQRREPVRVFLTREVRAAAAGTRSREDFEHWLARRPGVLIAWRYSQQNPGQVTGLRVGRLGDVDKSGQQIWFSGSKLAPDLSLPRLERRWAEVSGEPEQQGTRRDAWERSHRNLRRFDDAAEVPGVVVAEAATVLAHVTEGLDGGPLTDASADLARAVREPRGRRPEVGATAPDLRWLANDLASLGRATPGDAGDLMLFVGQILRLTDALMRQRRTAVAQVEYLTRARSHYDRWLGELQADELQTCRAALGEELAARLVADPAWPALAAELRRRGPELAVTDLAKVAVTRELSSAHSVAAVLHHRMLRDRRSQPQPAPKPARTTRTRRHGPAPRR